MIKNSQLIFHYITSDQHWKRINKNVANLPWKVKFGKENHNRFHKLVNLLENLEKRVWSIPSPSFTRTNFGLYGPGIILAVEYDNKIIASINFVGPILFEKNIHIWNLIVDPKYRNNKIASKLLITTLIALQKIADNCTLQTRTDSKALSLYIKLGRNTIIWCHAYDSGSWKKPKIGLKIKIPKDPFFLLSKKQKNLIQSSNTIKVRHDSVFWKKISEHNQLWGKIHLVGLDQEKEAQKLHLRFSNRNLFQSFGNQFCN